MADGLPSACQLSTGRLLATTGPAGSFWAGLARSYTDLIGLPIFLDMLGLVFPNKSLKYTNKNHITEV